MSVHSAQSPLFFCNKVQGNLQKGGSVTVRKQTAGPFLLVAPDDKSIHLFKVILNPPINVNFFAFFKVFCDRMRAVISANLQSLCDISFK
jgi:hypothetical protein